MHSGYSIAIKQLYNKQSNKGTGKTQIRDLIRKFNLKTPVCKKNQIKRSKRNSNCERNKIRLLIWTKVKFYSTKILFKLVKHKEGFETKIWMLESPDCDKRAKRKTKTKIGSEITIENNREKPEKKKN